LPTNCVGTTATTFVLAVDGLPPEVPSRYVHDAVAVFVMVSPIASGVPPVDAVPVIQISLPGVPGAGPSLQIFPLGSE
jgi:hypothetical protein